MRSQEGKRPPSRRRAESAGAEGAEYGRGLQLVLRDAAVSDGAMADGSLRMDVNVSPERLGPEVPV